MVSSVFLDRFNNNATKGSFINHKRKVYIVGLLRSTSEKDNIS